MYNGTSLFVLDLFLLHPVFKAIFIKARVERVEVLFVELVGEDSQVLAEALIVHYLALTQEANRVLDVGIVRKPENVVVSRAGFLFREGYLNSSKNYSKSLLFAYFSV